VRSQESARRVVLNQRLVKERDQARARDLRRVIWLCMALLVPVLFYVWQQVEYIRYGYQVEQLRAEKNRLLEWNRQLNLERATLLNLGRVEKLAAGELGLVPPGAGNTVKIRLTGESVAAQNLARRKKGPSEGLMAAER
jgi:cell division protein FtsL